MGDALYRFFLSIGVGLGLIAGQVDPTLSAKILRQDLDNSAGTMLVAAIHVDQAFSAGSRDLVESGSIVALRVIVKLVTKDGRSFATESTRFLGWDPRARHFNVGRSEEGKPIAFTNPEAAVTFASEFPDLAICPAEKLGQGGRVSVLASVGLIDNSGAWHEAPVLWNYVRPEASFTFASATEVPY